MVQELSIRQTATWTTGGSFLELYQSGCASGIYSGASTLSSLYGIDSNIRLLVDDTGLFIIVENAPFVATCLNLDLDKIT